MPSKALTLYSNLTPQQRAAINRAVVQTVKATYNVAAKQVKAQKQKQTARRATNRTRGGQRIYDPTDVVTTSAIAPVAYVTKWTSGAKSMRIRQSEIIGEISSDWFSWYNSFAVSTFPINPANPRTFPWLSYIARLYDKYRFHSLRFRFVNSCSTQREGNVIMALDYDTLDKAPESMVQASQLAKYTASPLYVPADFAVPVNHPGNNPWLYTFDLSATSGNVDLKTYNLGNLFFCVDSDSLGSLPKKVGYLAVDYDVELLDKNPVVDVFASKTFDSAAPLAKKARSNVDPADTLSVEWEEDLEDLDHWGSYKFTTDASAGAKIRMMVAHRFTGDAESESDISISASGGTGVEVLDGTTFTATAYPEFDMTCVSTFDILVGEGGTFNLYYTVTKEADVDISASPSTITNIMAFTYA